MSYLRVDLIKGEKKRVTGHGWVNISMGVVLLCGFINSVLAAPTTTIAVTSSFIKPAQDIVHKFSRQTGFKVRLVSASTGKLYTQIINGAPFDLLLAANKREPQRLEESGLAIKSTRFTYAIGRLVLWSTDATLFHADRGLEVFKDLRIKTLALANPQMAPYGEAAEYILKNAKPLGSRISIAVGDNVAQAFLFVASKSADLGFVALSQVLDKQSKITGSYWLIPEKMHAPISQQAVLLSRAKKNTVAKSFLQYLQSKEAAQIIVAAGYRIPRMSRQAE